jgi:hypothetical protein
MNATAKIGLFALAVLLVLAFFVLKIEDLPFPGKGRAVTAEVGFADVAGLDDKSAVRIAGVRVGKVDGIRLLPDGTAVARLLFHGEVELREGPTGRSRTWASSATSTSTSTQGTPRSRGSRRGRGFPGASRSSSTS